MILALKTLILVFGFIICKTNKRGVYQNSLIQLKCTKHLLSARQNALLRTCFNPCKVYLLSISQEDPVAISACTSKLGMPFKDERDETRLFQKV